jgi:hypothetical protein
MRNFDTLLISPIMLIIPAASQGGIVGHTRVVLWDGTTCTRTCTPRRYNLYVRA